jgi:hypothetical protein
MGLKLWVDDLRQEPNPGWALVRSVTEAIRYIDTMEVDEVSLDHDICHTSGTLIAQPYACTETYEPVARFIAAKPGGIKRVHIHTSNPAGAERMAAIIRGAQPHIKLSRRLGKIYEEEDTECKVDGQD